MANAHCMHYNFVCLECQEVFRKLMWINRDGEPEGAKCPKCEVKNFPFYEESKGVEFAMINTRMRDDWTKKLPGDWKNFLGSFEKRHSKYGRTVNTHSSGRTEI